TGRDAGGARLSAASAKARRRAEGSCAAAVAARTTDHTRDDCAIDDDCRRRRSRSSVGAGLSDTAKATEPVAPACVVARVATAATLVDREDVTGVDGQVERRCAANTLADYAAAAAVRD